MKFARLLLALAAAPLILTACEDDDPASPGDEVDVEVAMGGFDPPLLTLEPADSIAGSPGNGIPLTVEWKLLDGPHNVTFEAGQSSGSLQAGGTFKRDFSDSQAGTYRYRCTLHSTDFLTGEVGQIVVVK